MRLLPARPRAPFPVADRTRDGLLYETEHPRLTALRFCREHIADRLAGVDPYDEAVFILIARPHEVAFARRMLDLVGERLSQTANEDGSVRYRAILEADARVEFNLDETRNRPVMEDEPLASRAVAPDDAILRVLHPAQPRLEVVPDASNVVQLQRADRPLHADAMERARHLAALRVDCGCGALHGFECGCSDVDRLASAALRNGQVH